MEQHPVPQQISSYEFKLVGDMTLKQFGYLAGGVIIALIINSLPIPSFFKWILMGIAAFGGFAFAFMPVEGRPLSIWIIAFFKSVFSPTLYAWKKKGQQTITSQIKRTPTPQVPVPPLPVPPPGQAKVTTSVKPVIKTQPVASPKSVRLPEKPDRNGRPRVAAKTTTELPIPEPPTRPNLLVGMVLDKEGQMVEGAILEIRNSDGMPVRALRTNKLGQFRIATPLTDDVYEIETEKESLIFDVIKIEAKNEIIKPIEIKAK